MKRKPNIKHILFATALLVAIGVKAQQDPQYTHYMYNMSVVNPAYATAADGVINVGGLYRTQWVGAVGAPKTVNVFGHTPVGKRLEAGLSIVSDEIGDVVKENNVYVDLAYVIPTGTSTKLSFGVKAGATFFDADFNGFQYTDTAPDPAFAENIHQFFPNIGAGAFFFGEQFYLGLSAPNFLRTKHLEHQNAISTIGVEEIHYFFTGGYVFNVGDRMKLKPAFMTKAVSGAPMSLDVTANMLYNNFIEFGVGYRLDDSVSGLVNVYVTQQLRIGYSYDYTLTNLGNFNSGTHEIFLLYDIGGENAGKGKGYDKSPRFF